jgi:hypothetical protein
MKTTNLLKKAQLPPPLEKDEADTLMDYMHARNLRFTHIRNETGIPDAQGKIRNMRAILDYQAGVSPGFPDFCIILPRKGLLFIELKRERGGKVSEAQHAWILALNTLPGVQAEVCEGAARSIEVIERLYPQ